MIHGKVESVTLVEHISDYLDMCEIMIDFDILKIFGYYNEICEYIGKNVQYAVRRDMYKNKPIEVVANLANIYTIQTLEKTENIKLIPEYELERSVCNFEIDSLKYGDCDYNCICFLAGYEIGSSKKTQWVDCKMIDKKSKQFILRIFTKSVEGGVDAEEAIKSMVGCYVKFDITNTKYGNQTDCLELFNTPVTHPPEVNIAIEQIEKFSKEDTELKEYMMRYSYIEHLRNIIWGELGYHLVAIASELFLIQAISNISNEYDTKTLIRAVITSRGYLLPTKTKFSKPVLNTNKVLRSKLNSDRELILILDVFAEEKPSPTKKIYMEIGNMARKILNERRGIEDETDETDTALCILRNQLGGLF